MKCPICKTNSDIEFNTQHAAIYRCPVCKHCFSFIKRGYEVKYTDNYFNKEHIRWFNNPDHLLFKRLYKIIINHNPRASILDIGCGNGNFLQYMNKGNELFSLTGIDLYKNDPHHEIEFIDSDFFTYEFNKQFDVVVSLATIEHISDIQIFMKKMYQVCKPSGLLILMTVNDNGIIYKLSRLAYRFGFGKFYNRLYSAHHLNHFNVSSLKQLVLLSNLEIVKIIRHNFPLQAVDMFSSSYTFHYIMLSLLAILFSISKATGQTYLQTIICQKEFTVSNE